MSNETRTVSDELEFLKAGLSRKRTPLRWPPDMFGVSAALLSISGAYRLAAGDWPPGKTASSWVGVIQKIATRWRKGYETSAPSAIQKWWQIIIDNKDMKITDLCSNCRVCHALLQILAAADEASAGSGIPSPPTELDEFDLRAGTLLRQQEGTTLCDELKASPICVLPKMHAPQIGLTIRSFSHHLALISKRDIRAKWYTVFAETSKHLNLLVVPWPRKLRTTDFKPVPKPKSVMRNLPRKFGFFEFGHTNSGNFAHSLMKVFQNTCAKVGKIDAVILPECAITQDEYDDINAFLISQGAFLIAGVSGSRNKDGTVQNCVRYNIPVVGHEVPVRQSKHHRWKLDATQIRNYRLEHQLSPNRSWWEHIPIEDRTLNFVAFRPWLAVCALICEDLARPDPVGDVIRAVGPNLIIALLLDGPQLPGRWPVRYATALADDPGSSVLTVTSLGMAALSRPRKKGYRQHSATVASWKDARGTVVPIDLENGDAMVLGIQIEKREEWTADGRSDGREAGYPLLQSVVVLKDGKVKRAYRISGS